MKAAETSAAGKSIYSYDKNGTVAKAYAEFTREMAQVRTTNREACLRKMAIDGYIVRLDVSELKEQENFDGLK